ncbi:MAG: serine hydrolase domain-containing protein [Pseudomonadales bacterium]
MKFYRLLISVIVCVVFASGPAAQSLARESSLSIDEYYAITAKVDKDNWDNGGEISHYVYRHMARFFPQAIVPRAGPILPLEINHSPELEQLLVTTRYGELPLAEYVQTEHRVSGMIILHRGQRVFEKYPRMHESDHHIWFSVAKVMASTLVATLAEQGRLSVSDQVTKHLPELKGSGYDGSTIEHVLNMASGVDCIDADAGNYSNPLSCIYAMEAAMDFVKRVASTPATVFDAIADTGRGIEPGSQYRYSGADTFVLAWLAERVSGMAYADLMYAQIWSRLGAESTAELTIAPYGAPVAQGGISSSLRDLARFGLLFTPSGRKLSNQSIISPELIATIQTGDGEAFIAGDGVLINEHWLTGLLGASHNSYQWDYVLANGDFFKAGFAGQGLYVSPSRDLVIAWFGTQDEDGTSSEVLQLAPRIAASRLFDPKT